MELMELLGLRKSCSNTRWFLILDSRICFGFFHLLVVPSGYVKIAIENDHRNSGFTHWKWWFSIVMWQFTRGYFQNHESIIPKFVQIVEAKICTHHGLADIYILTGHAARWRETQNGSPSQNHHKITINGWYKPKWYRSIMVYYWVANISNLLQKTNQNLLLAPWSRCSSWGICKSPVLPGASALGQNGSNVARS